MNAPGNFVSVKVDPVRQRLKPEYAKKSKAGYVAKARFVTKYPLTKSPENFTFVVDFSLWHTKLASVTAKLLTSCCGGKVVPDLARGELICPLCHEKEPAYTETSALFYWGEVGITRDAWLQRLNSSTSTLASWLSVYTNLGPLEAVVEAGILEACVVATAHDFNRQRPSTDEFLQRRKRHRSTHEELELELLGQLGLSLAKVYRG